MAVVSFETRRFSTFKFVDMPFKFENLVVWQRAVDLSDIIHQLIKKFPKDELYFLTSQFKRAADSVSLNIAEGSTGQTNPEFNRFPGIALRSNIEVVGCLFLAKRREYIDSRSLTKYIRYARKYC